jgi:hypothetical protein
MRLAQRNVTIVNVGGRGWYGSVMAMRAGASFKADTKQTKIKSSKQIIRYIDYSGVVMKEEIEAKFWSRPLSLLIFFHKIVILYILGKYN